jgi:endonuclease YncB( thermonuclease family)
MTFAKPSITVIVSLVLTSIAAAAEIRGVPKILDGDTVEIAHQRIRIFGIDAPEMEQLCLDAATQRSPCGVDARNALSTFGARRSWSCVQVDVDQYGRHVARCQVEGQDVGRWMVAQGWALAFIRYSSAYAEDEKAARSARRGLWSGAFIAPWDWRSRSTHTVIHGAISVPAGAQKILLNAASEAGALDSACAIKGNFKPDGSCIYHQPGQRFYDAVHMNGSDRKRWFCTSADAEKAGCRAARW